MAHIELIKESSENSNFRDFLVGSYTVFVLEMKFQDSPLAKTTLSRFFGKS